jgi:nicotinamide riboside kinase
MAVASPFKIALIGSHGVGKTTLCFGLAARLKARHLSLEMVHEVARRCPLPINEETSREAQAWILHTQIAEELVAQSRYPLVLCDRAVIDNYTYLHTAHGSVPILDRLVDDWLDTYDELFLVPIVDAPQADGLRAVDPGFQAAIEHQLRVDLERRGRIYHDLACEPRERWLDVVEDLVIDALQPPQLELL